jgi:hypothetical protein
MPALFAGAFASALSRKPRRYTSPCVSSGHEITP